MKGTHSHDWKYNGVELGSGGWFVVRFCPTCREVQSLPMIPKEIIEKAVEGGWNTPYEKVKEYREGGRGEWIFRTLDGLGESWLTNTEIVLDPSFWRSLAKAGANCQGMKCYLCAGHAEGLATPFIDNGSGKGEPCPEHAGASFTYLILTNGDTKQFWSDLLKK